MQEWYGESDWLVRFTMEFHCSSCSSMLQASCAWSNAVGCVFDGMLTQYENICHLVWHVVLVPACTESQEVGDCKGRRCCEMKVQL